MTGGFSRFLSTSYRINIDHTYQVNRSSVQLDTDFILTLYKGDGCWWEAGSRGICGSSDLILKLGLAISTDCYIEILGIVKVLLLTLAAG